MIVNLKSPTEFSGFYIIFEGSTNIETEGQRGASHLLEHLICKTFQDLRNDFQKNAIDWNATTTQNNVLFYFTGLERDLSKYKNKILDRIFDFNITKKDFETERKIILEEYTDNFNKQSKRHILNLYRKHLNNFSAIGCYEDLEKIRFIDILNLYEKNYMKPNKIINISKAKEFKSNLIDFNDTKIDKQYTMAEYKNKIEPSDKDAKKKSVILLFELENENVNKLKFISKVLSSGLESPLYQETREKNALCYAISADVERFNNQGLLKIQTLTDKGNVNKIIDIIEKVLKNKKKHITQDRIDIVKASLLKQKEKNSIDQYLHVEEELLPPNFSIYEELKSIKLKSLMDIYEEMIINAKKVISVE